jgi:hypothetical protein
MTTKVFFDFLRIHQNSMLGVNVINLRDFVIDHHEEHEELEDFISFLHALHGLHGKKML